MNVRRLTRNEARRIAIRAQRLDAKRPHDLGAIIDRLTLLQLDPTAAVAPSADPGAWTRLGNAYEPAHLQRALERDRTLFEHRCQEVETEPVAAMVRPMSDLSLYAARRIRDERRLRSLGVARPPTVGDAGTPAEIEGTSGLWRVDPEATTEGFEGRTALLSPLDRLIHDRGRALELFDFEFFLETYKPKAKRRWGYSALPVLHRDQLVGKVDATTDRDTSRLLVHAVHHDVPFTRVMTTAVHAELEALLRWLGLDYVRYA